MTTATDKPRGRLVWTGEELVFKPVPPSVQVQSQPDTRKRHKRRRECHISDHAFTRANDRAGWSRETTIRMASRARQNGVSWLELKGFARGLLRRHATGIRDGDDVRIYGPFLYVFRPTGAGVTLVTILNAEKFLLRCAIRARGKGVKPTATEVDSDDD